MFGNLFKKKPAPLIQATARASSLFSTHAEDFGGRGSNAILRRRAALAERINLATRGPVPVAREGRQIGTFDADDIGDSVKPQYGLGFAGINDTQLMWYSSQGFIGYQMCAILAQHWMIDKACTMPAKDAVRKGYQITLNNGEKLDPKVLDLIREFDEDKFCLLYTSDAADDLLCVDLGGRRIIK